MLNLILVYITTSISALSCLLLANILIGFIKKQKTDNTYLFKLTNNLDNRVKTMEIITNHLEEIYTRRKNK